MRICKKLCKELGIELFSVSLNIREMAEKENISIEEAAREGRYRHIFYLKEDW